MTSTENGLALIALAGIMQGIWPLGLKKAGPLSWEAFWAPFSLVGMLLIPLIASRIFFPDFGSLVADVAPGSFIQPLVCGVLWGCGSVAFGVSLGLIGTSLSFGINMGLGAAVGALIPFFQQGSHSIGSWLSFAGAMIATLGGIVLISRAGILRDRCLSNHRLSGFRLRLGFILAICAGLATAAFNIGYNSCEPLVSAAVSHGYTPLKAGFLPWLVIFWSGVTANVMYCLFLLIRNQTYRDYLKPNAVAGLGAVLGTALLWVSAIGLYGVGAGRMGNDGPVIGWIVFLAVSLLVNTALGIRAGEWAQSEQSKPVLYIGNALLGVSWFFMGFI